VLSNHGVDVDIVGRDNRVRKLGANLLGEPLGLVFADASSAERVASGIRPRHRLRIHQIAAADTSLSERQGDGRADRATPEDGDPACMRLSLSSVPIFHPFAFLLGFILLFDPRREHSSAPTAYFHRRRAQRRSRTALLQRRRRLVLDGREHGGRLPAIGRWPR
jgi:hypothetical protein